VTQRLASGFAWQGATKAITQALTWISMIVVARLLSPEQFGIAAVATVVIGVLTTLMEMGLSSALIQKENVTTEEEDGVFYLSIIISLSLYAVLYFSSPAIAGFYEIPVLEDLLRLVGIALIFGSLRTVPLARAMRLMDFRYRSLVEMGANLGSSVVIIILATNGFGVWSLAWGVVATFFLMAAGYLPLMDRWPKLSLLRLRKIKGVVSYGMQMMGGQLAFALQKESDVFIIGKVLGGAATGFYTMASKVADAPLEKIATIFIQVSFPALSRLRADNPGSQKVYLDLHRYLLAVCLPLLFGLLAVAHDTVAVVLSEKWLPMVPILQVLCIFNAIRISGSLIGPALNSRGRVDITLRYSLISVIVLPAAYYGAAALGSVVTVALARLAVYPLFYLGLLYYLFREMGLSTKQFWGSIRSPFISAIVMLIAVSAFQYLAEGILPVGRLAVSVGVGALVYLGCYRLLFPEEIRQVRQAWAVLRGRPVAQPG